MEGKLNTLRLMFPNTSMDQAINALKANNWDLDQTIDYLLATTEADEIAKKEEEIPAPSLVKKIFTAPIISIPPIQLPKTRFFGGDKKVEHVTLVESTKKPVESVASLETLSPRSLSGQKIDEVVNVVKPIPARPPKPSSAPSNEISSDDEILREFLVLEKQHQPVPAPLPTIAPVPSPVNVIELPKPSIAQKVVTTETDLESAQRDISLLKSISNTLRELENEIRNINFDSNQENKNNNENNNNNDIDNDDQSDDDDENNDNEEESLLDKLPRIEVAIEQLETLFNASREKTERVLNTVKEEIESWNIKDNVKTFTSTIRLELSEMLESIANYINPIPIAAQEEERLERQEEKRNELKKKLQDLKEYNARLEEERRAAIEKIEKKQPDQELPPPPPLPNTPLPPPPAPNAAPGYYYYDPSAPNVFYYHPLNQPYPPTQPFPQPPK